MRYLPIMFLLFSKHAFDYSFILLMSDVHLNCSVPYSVIYLEFIIFYKITKYSPIQKQAELKLVISVLLTISSAN